MMIQIASKGRVLTESRPFSIFGIFDSLPEDTLDLVELTGWNKKPGTFCRLAAFNS
jgi:hypothetical protein